jgi:hypothetical protein
MPTIAKVTDPERAKKWREIFGTDKVPIISPIPTMATLPGFEEPQSVYLLDLSAITPEQREKLVQHTAERFGLDPIMVDVDLDKVGMPILADQVVMSSDDVGLLMSMMDDDHHDPDFPYWDEYEGDLLNTEDAYGRRHATE